MGRVGSKYFDTLVVAKKMTHAVSGSKPLWLPELPARGKKHFFNSIYLQHASFVDLVDDVLQAVRYPTVA